MRRMLPQGVGRNAVFAADSPEVTAGAAHADVTHTTAVPGPPARKVRRMTTTDSAQTPPQNAARKAPAKDPWDLPDVSGMTVGVLGGTGDQGQGLAYRLARAGQKVIIGSRAADRARAVAEELGHGVEGADNAECARRSDIVIVAVPWEGHAKTLESLREDLTGKLVVDCVNPLGFDKKGAYALDVEEGSAAQQAAALLPDSRVTAAFHHLSAVLLKDPEIDEIETDVMVLGEERDDVEIVQALAGRIPGMRGVFAGRLRNAHQVESLVANLISVNRRYKAHAGLRVTDV
jgi:NADPH-dependent F420 reductase